MIMFGMLVIKLVCRIVRLYTKSLFGYLQFDGWNFKLLIVSTNPIIAFRNDD